MVRVAPGVTHLVPSPLWCHGIRSFSVQSYCQAENVWSLPATPRSTSPNNQGRARYRRMAGRDASVITGRRTCRATDVCAHRYHEGAEPSRRTRVRSVAQRQTLGTAEVGSGSMTGARKARIVSAGQPASPTALNRFELPGPGSAARHARSRSNADAWATRAMTVSPSSVR